MYVGLEIQVSCWMRSGLLEAVATRGQRTKRGPDACFWLQLGVFQGF